MKFKIIYTFFFALGALFLMSSSGGRAAAQNWGNTGAPGDQLTTAGAPRTCITCHATSASLQVTLDLELFDQNGDAVENGEYLPGETYLTRVTMNTASGSPSGFGFQILCLNAPEGDDGAEVSSWANPTDNVQIATASNTGRTYAEHNGVTDNNIFEMEWTAPAEGAGAVTFYSCGNGVNKNEMTSGDGADCKTLTLQEGTLVMNTSDLIAKNLEFTITPNLITDQASLEVLNGQGYFDLNIINLNGQTVQKEQITVLNAWQKQSLSFQDLTAGIYLLQLTNGNQSFTQKIIKQ